MKILDWSQPESALSFHTETILEALGWKDFYHRAVPDQILKGPNDVEFDLHKWPFDRTQEMLSLFPTRPEKVQLLECADAFVKKGAKLWPELMLPIALKRAVRRRIQAMDLRLTAYIIGEDVTIRPMVATATGLGFSEICLVSNDEKFLEEQKTFLKRRLIGINFVTILTSDLTLQTQNAGFLINTLDLRKANDSLQDIAYFNFMTSNGIFIDLYEGGPHKILQDEAQRAHLNCVRPLEIEWAWWVEAGLRLENPLTVSEEKAEAFLQKL